MNETLIVGISDMKTALAGQVLVTYALGSCVGVCLYDPMASVGALGHILLPQSGEVDAKTLPFRYADTCIPLMLQALDRLGCSRYRLRAKIAGGAKMFELAGDETLGSIGNRNAEAVKSALAAHRIPLAAEDTGGTYGRTMFFTPADGKVVIKSYAKGEYNL